MSVHPTNEQPSDDRVSGEVLSIDADLATVRLASGETGILPLSSTSATVPPSIGTLAVFQILGRDDQGRPQLALSEDQEETAAQLSFENDVVSLKNALRNNHHTPQATPSRQDSTREERIHQWIAQVDKEIARLRKHRAKRLDEEFYSSR